MDYSDYYQSLDKLFYASTPITNSNSTPYLDLLLANLKLKRKFTTITPPICRFEEPTLIPSPSRSDVAELSSRGEDKIERRLPILLSETRLRQTAIKTIKPRLRQTAIKTVKPFVPGKKPKNLRLFEFKELQFSLINCPNPDEQDYKEISERVGISIRRVKNWYAKNK